MESFNRLIGIAIKSDVKKLSIEAYQLQLTLMPELKSPQLPEFLEKSIRDTEFTVLYLSNAISVSSPKIFVNYIDWFITLMESINLPVKYLHLNVECIFEVVKNNYSQEYIDAIEPYIQKAMQRFIPLQDASVAPLINTHFLKPYRDQYINYLLTGDRYKANELVKKLVSSAVVIEDIYMEIFHESQREIGRLWQTNVITIAEEHYCTAATQLIMGQLYPLIFATPKRDLVFVGACVGGELHELGVRMVSDFMELSGWHTYYLGANTPINSIVEALVKERANVIGISVTMSYHIEEAIQLIDKIKSDARCSAIKILVGGYPFIVDDQLWQTIGADGFAQNARDAVSSAEKLVAEVAYD